MIQALLSNQEDFQQVEHLHVAELIATAIVERLQQKGQCSIMDIKAMGFSLNDIARYWPESCKIAESRSSRLVRR